MEVARTDAHNCPDDVGCRRCSSCLIQANYKNALADLGYKVQGIEATLEYGKFVNGTPHFKEGCFWEQDGKVALVSTAKSKGNEGEMYCTHIVIIGSKNEKDEIERVKVAMKKDFVKDECWYHMNDDGTETRKTFPRLRHEDLG